MQTYMSHTPVLLHEAIDNLNLGQRKVFFDATLGGGGHSNYVNSKFDGKITIVGTDKDCDAVARVHSLLPNAHLACAPFSKIDEVLESYNLTSIDAALFDLGISSFQLDTSGRGFSFQKDEPLLMTMKRDPNDDDITAKDIVNLWSEETLADIIYAYGEERYARRIARAIVEARNNAPIETTKQLADIVAKVVPSTFGRKIHPATKTFQALRIVVNKELEEIKIGLRKALGYLTEGGRIAAISFHSLEDRIVKDIFKEAEEEGVGKRITKKPLTPSEQEVKMNPRSRSAKLRIFEKANHV